jgi:hypothetical protein
MNAKPPAWLEPVLQFMQDRIPQDFVGQIEVNCFLGGITNVNVRQSYKPPPHKEKHHGEERDKRAN